MVTVACTFCITCASVTNFNIILLRIKEQRTIDNVCRYCNLEELRIVTLVTHCFRRNFSEVLRTCESCCNGNITSEFSYSFSENFPPVMVKYERSNKAEVLAPSS